MSANCSLISRRIQTPSKVGQSDQHLDLSITLLPQEQAKNYSTRFHHSSLSANTNFNSSYLPGDNLSLSEKLVADAISASHQPYNEKIDMLFPQFLEVLQGRTSDSEVFETIQDIIHTCAGITEDMDKQRLQNHTTIGNEKLKYKHCGMWLQDELKTWKLLYALYKDRIMLQHEGCFGKVMECEDVSPALGGSEKEVITQLYTYNSTLREYQLIVDWLESCYDTTNKAPNIPKSSDRTVGWENTLFQLQQRRAVVFTTDAEIIRSMDPDAPLREKKALNALDAEDNALLSKCVFGEIRQGRIEEAMALCKYCGHTWKAALLEGWRLHEDPNYDSLCAIGEKMPIEGNPRRDLWKKSAWMMADSYKFDEYTRAIAAVFCGHLNALKSLLKTSWEDLLWGYLKVQIDIRVESEIRSCCVKQYHPMPDNYWNAKMPLEQIFEELSVHNDASVREHSRSKIAIIQKFLIMDNVAELLQEMRLWIDESCDNENDFESQSIRSHMLRFLTHIVLFMRQIGRVDKEDTADRVIAAYVECLIGLGDPHLVAFYTAALPSKLQVLLYSKFLETITESVARATALKEAVQAGLDVALITRHTVENIRQHVNADDYNNIDSESKLQTGDISNFDMNKIRALEWLTFMPSQRGELLWQANAIIRCFLGMGNTECVRATYDMVPSDSLTQIINTFGSKESIPCREECSIKEYLCYKVYLTAIDSFNDWSRLYHNKPKEPCIVSASANFTERVASDHKLQAFRVELDRWNISLTEQVKITCDALYNVLLFPEMGWLIDPDIQNDALFPTVLEWENRRNQIEKLRSICIPEVVLLLHKVLHFSGDYSNCVKLADEIAAETRQLYKVYTKHKLAELMAKISESSLELLHKKLDPWGFSIAA